jgi:hypothetical protein
VVVVGDTVGNAVGAGVGVATLRRAQKNKEIARVCDTCTQRLERGAQCNRPFGMPRDRWSANGTSVNLFKLVVTYELVERAISTACTVADFNYFTDGGENSTVATAVATANCSATAAETATVQARTGVQLLVLLCCSSCTRAAVLGRKPATNKPPQYKHEAPRSTRCARASCS